MLVFTLPSFPYVFKVISDVFGGGKDTDRATVRSKFDDGEARRPRRTAGRHARVRRPGAAARALLAGAARAARSDLAPSMIAEGDPLVIRHCYVERRMVPLNIYIDRALPEELEAAVRRLRQRDPRPRDRPTSSRGTCSGGTSASRATAVSSSTTTTRSSTSRDVNFRRIPAAPNAEAELAAEPWYGVMRNDVFPEEFATFLLGDPRVRELFLRHHADLLEPEFWQACPAPDRSGRDRSTSSRTPSRSALAVAQTQAEGRNS